jgi:hypothetical protein
MVTRGSEDPAAVPGPSEPAAPEPAARAGLWVALSLICLWASAALVYPAITKYVLYEPGFGGKAGDTGQYVRMYQGVPLGEIIRPFRYRVFTPYLARLVPSIPHGLLRYFDVTPDKLVQYHFGIVNMLGLAVSGLLLVHLCQLLGFPLLQGLLGALLFYTSFPVVNYAGAPMVDAWAYAFMLLGLVAVLRGSLAWLAIASILGMLAKETTLIVIPALLLLDRRPMAKVQQLAAMLPGIAFYLVFRLVLYPGGYGFSSNPILALQNLISRLQQGTFLWWILLEGFTAFGLLCPLAILGAWSLRDRPRDPLMRLAWLVPAVLLLPLVNALGIGSGIGRIWFYSFPAMIPLTLVGLQRLLRPRGAPGAPMAPAPR